jgi:hypothetical protein
MRAVDRATCRLARLANPPAAHRLRRAEGVGDIEHEASRRFHHGRAECAVRWADAAQREHAWEVCRELPPPAGHDPAHVFPEGPHAAGAAVLRLEPWRLRVASAEQMAAGAALAWRRVS